MRYWVDDGVGIEVAVERVSFDAGLEWRARIFAGSDRRCCDDGGTVECDTCNT